MKKAYILYSPGTNCEEETMRAFELAGAIPELLFLDDVISGKKKISDCDLFCFPGGFSFGDHIGAGAIAAALIKDFIPELLEAQIPVIGICNGFQVMVRAGMFGPGIALARNDSGVFCSRPAQHEVIGSNCIWTRNLERQILSFPAAHKFGKLSGENLSKANVVMDYYPHSPNGGFEAALTSENGLLLGLMDHPERPFGNPDGLKLFWNAITEV